MTAHLEQLCRDVRALLLDFDGPVCSIFANCPAPQVARELLDLLVSQGLALTDELAEESDPLEVLRQTGNWADQELTRLVEGALIAAEVKAASSAEPTAYGREVIVAARQLHVPIAVVSNNSPQAVDTYLRAHRLSQHVAKTVGRAYADPARMKPNPAPIFDASVSLGVVPALCVLVGDSLSDIEGAKAAGARVIGYANKPGKAAAFQAAGADAVVTSMRQIAQALMQVEGL
ncbi:HAD family hydrolase [Micromonospora sp. NPDC006431]|uniref:HAD family hydrolase n=1 Tax=Micromonospora sp. NPDC006431 TaxID=3364235 RepID=UPI0036AA299B